MRASGYAPRHAAAATRGERPGAGRPLLWVLALLVGSGLLLLLTLALRADPIEDDLRARSLLVLREAGFETARVDLDGRDATIANVPADQARQAIAAVEEVRGVRTVQIHPGADVPNRAETVRSNNNPAPHDRPTISQGDTSPMIWLVAQTWILLLVSFLLGSLATWFLLPRRKRTGDADHETDRRVIALDG